MVYLNMLHTIELSIILQTKKKKKKKELLPVMIINKTFILFPAVIAFYIYRSTICGKGLFAEMVVLV